MRAKARCCSAHLCLLGRWAAGSRHTCLYTCSPAPVTFGQNDIQAIACVCPECSRVQHCAHYLCYRRFITSQFIVRMKLSMVTLTMENEQLKLE